MKTVMLILTGPCGLMGRCSKFTKRLRISSTCENSCDDLNALSAWLILGSLFCKYNKRRIGCVGYTSKFNLVPGMCELVCKGA